VRSGPRPSSGTPGVTPARCWWSTRPGTEEGGGNGRRAALAHLDGGRIENAQVAMFLFLRHATSAHSWTGLCTSRRPGLQTCPVQGARTAPTAP
jgi:hypothetical protein